MATLIKTLSTSGEIDKTDVRKRKKIEGGLGVSNLANSDFSDEIAFPRASGRARIGG